MLIQNRIRQIIFAAALAAIALGLLMGSLIPTARADGIVVNSAADTVPADDGVCTLREAIINANNDASTWASCAAGSGADTITFRGTVGDITLTSALPQITGDLTINGLKVLTNNQRISGANLYRVFDVASGATFNLRYVVVTNGATGSVYPDNSGGGLRLCNWCQATVERSVFSYNRAADYGGAIFSGNVLTVTNSTFISNTAVAQTGGAINNSGTLLVVSSSDFISNTAQNGGGAIYSGGSTSLSVTDSDFTANRVVGAGSYGGAINSDANVTTLDNNTFTGNSAAGGGGGVYGSGDVLNVTRSDFISNSAVGWGGAFTALGPLVIPRLPVTMPPKAGPLSAAA